MLRVYKNTSLAIFIAIIVIVVSYLYHNKVKECVLDSNINSYLIDKQWAHKTALKGGISGFSVSRVYDEISNSYVLKDIHQKSFKEKNAEIYAHKIASELGYGALLYAYDVEKGLILTQFLQNSSKQLSSESMLQMITSALHALHSGSSLCDTPSIIERINLLYNKLDHNRHDVDTQAIESIINEILVYKDEPKYPTHRDLNKNNIFFTDEGVKFIDFENAGQDDRFFDIASIIILHQYDEKTENEFLKLYFGKELNDDEKKHLKTMKKAVSIFSGLTLLSKGKNIGYTTIKEIPDLHSLSIQIDEEHFSLDSEINIYILALSFLQDAVKNHS